MYYKLVLLSLIMCMGSVCVISENCQAQEAEFTNDEDQTTELDLNFFGDARIRYQHIDQENLIRSGEALTFRLKGGAELEVGNLFSALIELEAGHQLVDDFNDTTNGRFDRPMIMDVEGIELHRLQLQTEVLPNTRLTLGRQIFALDDWRFLGQWQFRQNEQTVDAIRTETSLGEGSLNLGFINKIHRHLGDDSAVGEFSGDSYIMNFSHPLPLGKISVFHYALDLETGPPIARVNILSNATTGMRWHGRRHWGDYGINWEAAYARQKDYGDNPNSYSADYSNLSLGIEFNDFTLSGAREILGSDDGVSVQTPLGSLHGFQGVTDRFFRTPGDGLKDYEVGLDYDLGRWGDVEKIKFGVGHHWFRSDRNSRAYGTEFNVNLNMRFKDVDLLLEYGDYSSDALSSDTGLFVNDAKAFIISASYSFD